MSKGIENEHTFTKQSDIVFKDDLVTAFVSPQWWPNNKGHVVIISNNHSENIFDISNSQLHAIYKAAKTIALALKQLYQCDGISTRQHNEPDGGQEVWHFHLHIFPRYAGDNFYITEQRKQFVSVEEREPYVKKLQEYFGKTFIRE